MKILFVIRDVSHHVPLGVAQLSALARARGHRSDLGVVLREDVVEKACRLRPDLIAYSGSTGEHKYFTALNRRVRDRLPGAVAIMGGPHATFFADWTLRDLNLDAVCIGEGDDAFDLCLDRVSAGAPLDGLPNMLTPGMAASGVRPPLQPLVQDLDRLPFPDRDLFFRETDNGRLPIKHFMIGRGCPYRCTYCFNGAFKDQYPGQRYVRRHSVDYVIEEIRAVRAQYPIEYVKFYDDIFTSCADDWLETFSARYRAEVGLPFYCLTRADLLDADMVRLLKDAGCRVIQMAAESADERTRRTLLGRHMTDSQLRRAFDMCRDHGITVVTNYMLGLPTSCIEDDVRAVTFNIEAGVSVPEFPIFQPYPGTELGALCVRAGWFDGDLDAIHASYNHRSPLACFSERDKDIQRNIACLGQLANTYAATRPSLTALILDRLIYGPPRPLYADLYARHKWKLYNALVYQLAHPPGRQAWLRARSLTLGVSQRTDEEVEPWCPGSTTDLP